MHQGISAEYLSTALANISSNASLKIKSVAPIGTGQMAESYRVIFESIANKSFPESVVVKVPSQNENSRGASRATRCYELETSFYSMLRSHVEVNTPKCLHVWFDAPADDFVLILEDISNASQGDQIRGASIDQANAAIDELVNLHAPLWNSPKLDSFSWLPRHSGQTEAGIGDLLRAVFPSFAERFEQTVNSEVIRLGERLVANIERYNSAFPKNTTIVHRDFRLDNLLFVKNEVGFEVKVVDWQTVGALPGAADLGYFIGASFNFEDRRKNELALVKRYHQGLKANKIEIQFNDLWSQYRLLGTSGYIMAIVASVLVKQTDRGDAMFAAMANRHGQQMLDLESESLFS